MTCGVTKHRPGERFVDVDCVRTRYFDKGSGEVLVLLVWGYNDPTAALKRGQYLFELIANRTPMAEMHVNNHAGHFCYREQPETFNYVIQGFASRRRQPPR